MYVVGEIAFEFLGIAFEGTRVHVGRFQSPPPIDKMFSYLYDEERKAHPKDIALKPSAAAITPSQKRQFSASAIEKLEFLKFSITGF